MNNRSIAVVAGVAALALTLTGCSADESVSGSESAGSLTISTTSNNQKPMETVVAAYEEATGISVNLTVADTAQFQTTIRTQLSSGTAPDVFTVWAGSGNPGAIDILHGAGYLADLSDRPWVGEVEPGTAAGLQIDGRTFGLPSKLDAIGAIYNIQTLDDLGLEVPETYTDLLQFCTDVRAQGKSAFALGIQSDWTTQLIPYALVASTVYGTNPDFDAELSAGTATFADSGWADAFEKMMEMSDTGCFQDDPLGTDVTASYGLLHAGDAVATVQVLASFPQIESTAPAGSEFGFFPLPANDTGINPIPRGIGVSFAVNEAAKNKDAALDFVDWLATPEAIEIWFNAAPGIPAIAGAEVEAAPVIAAAAAIITDGKTASFPDQSWPSAKVQSELFSSVQKLFTGQASVEQALNALDETYSAR